MTLTKNSEALHEITRYYTQCIGKVNDYPIVIIHYILCLNDKAKYGIPMHSIHFLNFIHCL